MSSKNNQYPNLIEYNPDIYSRALSPEQSLVLGLNVYEEKVYHTIANKTGGGYNQNGIPLTAKQFMALTNIGRNYILASLKSLEEKKIIRSHSVREGRTYVTYYSLVYLPNTPLTDNQLNELNTKLSPVPIPDPKNPYGI